MLKKQDIQAQYEAEAEYTNTCDRFEHGEWGKKVLKSLLIIKQKFQWQIILFHIERKIISRSNIIFLGGAKEWRDKLSVVQNKF